MFPQRLSAWLLNALVFLYKRVLDIPIDQQIAPLRSQKDRRMPTVLTKAEVVSVLERMDGTHALMAKQLYGVGAFLSVTFIL
jgi:hypothetical protein